MNENLLRADQIGLGVVSVNEAMVVLYTKVDPRLVMKKLDEKFGPLGWKKETQITYSPTLPGGNFVKMGHCTLSVFDKDIGEWISRDDYGSPAAWAGETEDKVIASDCLKRAATNFGIARELYSFDNICCKTHDDQGNPVINIQMAASGEYYTLDRFTCAQVKYDNEENIVAIAVKNESTGKMVFAENREKLVRANATIVPSKQEISPVGELEQALEMVPDIGTKYMGMHLKDLRPHEILWLYSNTKSPEIKRACLVMARNIQQLKLIFAEGGVQV